MHGLNTIKRLNKTEQDFIDHILSTPVPDVNLLDGCQSWTSSRELGARWASLRLSDWAPCGA